MNDQRSLTDQMRTLRRFIAIRDDVWAELIACYGEDEDTDWPYLSDLCDLIMAMIVKYAEPLVGEVDPQ